MKLIGDRGKRRSLYDPDLIRKLNTPDPEIREDHRNINPPPARAGGSKDFSLEDLEDFYRINGVY